MSGGTPGFDELVGGDIDAAERERLLRAHDALVAAGPAPELSRRLATAPPVAGRRAVRRFRPARALALAAALAIAAFAIGVAVGDRLTDPGTFAVIAMSGTASAPGATASIEVFDLDAAGNWPMELSVRGLGPAPEGRLYELWLTKGDRLAELCGSFLAETDGTTAVPMNAPYKLKDYDAWVIVEQGSEEILLTT